MGRHIHGKSREEPLKKKPGSKPITIPGYGNLEFEQYSQTFDPTTDEKDFVKKIKREEGRFKELDRLASQCVGLLEKAQAEGSDLASAYWKIGDLIVSYEKTLPATSRRESFEKKSNYFEHLAKKIHRQRGKFSLRYVRKIVDFRNLVTERELDDSVPWSVQFEFLELGDNKKAWKHYADLYRQGKMTKKEEIRASIDAYRQTRVLQKALPTKEPHK